MLKELPGFLKASTLVSLFLCLGTATSQAEKSSIFVLDTSGSMWGQLEDGRTKITVARDVLGKILTSLPQDVSSGLIAYGHRRKGDCTDIETVAPIKSNVGDVIAAKIQSLSPRGKTPIADALQMAGTQIQTFDGDRSIVLISDGIETCSGDPCAVAEALKNSQADLKIHVVGYGVDLDASLQLQCVAEKGGGAYFNVKDTQDLSTALAEVKNSIETQQAIVVEAPKVEPAEAGTTITIAGPGTIELQLASWVKQPKYWKVTEPETGDEVSKTNKNKVTVLSGEYRLTWRQSEHDGQDVDLPKVVQVKSGETTQVKIDTGAHLIAPEGMPKPYYWQLLSDESELEIWPTKRTFAAQYELWEPVPVPPGKYSLVVRQSEHGHSEVNLGKVTFEEGKLTEYPLDQGLNLAWRDDWGKIKYLKITDEDGREHKFNQRGPIVLAPGKYQIALRLTEHNHSEADFGEITVDETGFVDPKLSSGIKFDTKLSGETKIYAINLDTGAEAKIEWSKSSKNPWPAMPLGAGRYIFDIKFEGAKRKPLVAEVVIKPGQFVTAKF